MILVVLIPGLLLILVAGQEIGFRFGRSAGAGRETSAVGPIATVQAGTLGLLGLLLAFSFGGAASRFIERQDLIVEEANAIGTAFLRADMLGEPHRSELRSGLAGYLASRIEVSRTLSRGIAPESLAAMSEWHDRIWTAARDGVTARPEAMLTVLGPVNDVIDLHSTRVAAARKHIPLPVMMLLIGCSVVTMLGIGFGCGLAGRRSLVMTGSMMVLIAAAIWTTIDLDHPRAGVLTLNDAPLVEMRATMSRPDGRAPGDGP
jgi:hypothetical protein